MTARDPDFFVGYLPLPAKLRWFLLLVVAGFMGFAVGLALVVVFAQPPRGTGMWDQAGERTIAGRLVLRPYPAVIADDGGIVLLVDEWKHGVDLDAMHQDGERITVQGYARVRGDLTVLQLDAPPNRIDAGAANAADAASRPITLTGEIVDAKCWAGAMNPGDRKAHHACGSLCLVGNIPAMFVTTRPDGGTDWYLLGDKATGGPLGEEARAFVGQRLTLGGEATATGGLKILKIELASLAASR